jgi:tRNA(adenine34) deaminase
MCKCREILFYSMFHIYICSHERHQSNKTVAEAMNPFDDAYFMQQALAEATIAAREGEAPVGAVVACNNRIIARAHNQTERLNDPTAHAEMLAITAAANSLGAKYLTDCTLYVTLEPCVMCAGAIAWAQTGALVYGADDPKRGFLRYAPNALHPKTILRSGILAAECAALLTDFFRKRR